MLAMAVETGNFFVQQFVMNESHWCCNSKPILLWWKYNNKSFHRGLCMLYSMEEDKSQRSLVSWQRGLADFPIGQGSVGSQLLKLLLQEFWAYENLPLCLSSFHAGQNPIGGQTSYNRLKKSLLQVSLRISKRGNEKY